MTILLILMAVAGANVFTIIVRHQEAWEKNVTFSNSRYKPLIFLLIVADLLIIGAISLIFFMFTLNWLVRSCIILLGAAAVLMFTGLMVRWWNPKRLMAWGLCVALGVSGLVGAWLYRIHTEAITMKDYFDYHTYAPFQEDSLVAKLDEPATLHFQPGDYLPRMDGATALYPVYAAFAQATYQDTHASKRADIYEYVDCSTTSKAYENIVDGACDMIFVAGPSEAQEAYAKKKGVELVYTPIGKEAFVFFVHPKNPVDGMSLDQIRGIYSGQITDWEQLGAPKLGKILAYQRDEGSGSQTALERFVMGDTPLMEPKRDERVDAMGGIIDKVSDYQNHRNALGFSFRFYCTALMKNFDVKLLAINGVEPTVENIENGSYPLASSFYVVTRSDANESTRALVDWICSEQGQELIEKTGYSRLPAER